MVKRRVFRTATKEAFWHPQMPQDRPDQTKSGSESVQISLHRIDDHIINILKRLKSPTTDMW